MANPTTVGYLLSFDGTVIIDIVGATTLRATNVLQNAAVVNDLTFTIPSGVKIDYNGTSAATTTPGQLAQEFIATSGGKALYGVLKAKLGTYGTSILSPLDGTSDLSNTGTRLVGVEDVTPSNIERVNSMHIRVTVSIVGDWL